MSVWTMKIIVFGNVTTSSQAEIYRRFGEPYYLYIHSKQPWRRRQHISQKRWYKFVPH